MKWHWGKVEWYYYTNLTNKKVGTVVGHLLFIAYDPNPSGIWEIYITQTNLLGIKMAQGASLSCIQSYNHRYINTKIWIRPGESSPAEMHLEFYRWFVHRFEDMTVLAQTFCSVMKRRSVTAVNQDRNSLCVVHVGLLRSEELLDATDGLSTSWKTAMRAVCTWKRHVVLTCKEADEPEIHTHTQRQNYN